eukprot:4420550-Pyramimonas_sp.AAC.1
MSIGRSAGNLDKKHLILGDSMGCILVFLQGRSGDRRALDAACLPAPTGEEGPGPEGLPQGDPWRLSLRAAHGMSRCHIGGPSGHRAQ